jgi:hypothetical protein
MPAPRTGELTVIGVAVVAVVIVAISAAAGGQMTDDTLPSGSTFSYGPSGTAAAYQTLQRLGYTMRRSIQPVSSLEGEPVAAVVILSDPSDPASNHDRRAIQAFLANGGTVLATGCVGATYLSSAAPGVGPPYSSAEAYAARRPSPLTRDAPSISMTSGCLSSALGDRYAGVYGRESVDVVYEAWIGRGHAIWWEGTTPIENRTIDAPGHLELLLNAIGPPPRTIVWDEFSHGQRASLWSYLARTPAPWAFAQLALAAGVAAVMFVRRRLPIRAPVTMARTSPLEFVETMAELYGRAKSGAAAAGIARARLRRLLLASSGIAPSAPDARLADAAAGRVSMPPDELRELLEAAERSATDLSTSPAAALPLVRRMQAVSARINGG